MSITPARADAKRRVLNFYQLRQMADLSKTQRSDVRHDSAKRLKESRLRGDQVRIKFLTGTQRLARVLPGWGYRCMLPPITSLEGSHGLAILSHGGFRAVPSALCYWVSACFGPSGSVCYANPQCTVQWRGPRRTLVRSAGWLGREPQINARYWPRQSRPHPQRGEGDGASFKC